MSDPYYCGRLTSETKRGHPVLKWALVPRILSAKCHWEVAAPVLTMVNWLDVVTLRTLYSFLNFSPLFSDFLKGARHAELLYCFSDTVRTKVN